VFVVVDLHDLLGDDGLKSLLLSDFDNTRKPDLRSEMIVKLTSYAYGRGGRVYFPAILACLVLSSMRSRYAKTRARLSTGAAEEKERSEIK
jgi:hypothetical protein